MNPTPAVMPTEPARSPAALSAAQLKDQLWADDAQQLFAVVMGTRVPDLPARLARAELIDWDCLLPGALAAHEQADAPYLVQLKRESAFTDWLLFEASASLGDWGVLVSSAARRLTLRSHLRSLLQARLPDGRPIALDWMDPAVLQLLLPLFDAVGLSHFFGPVGSVSVAGADTWFTASVNLGQLAARITPLAKAA